jgi:hypothetical protein
MGTEADSLFFEQEFHDPRARLRQPNQAAADGRAPFVDWTKSVCVG